MACEPWQGSSGTWLQAVSAKPTEQGQSLKRDELTGTSLERNYRTTTGSVRMDSDGLAKTSGTVISMHKLTPGEIAHRDARRIATVLRDIGGDGAPVAD